MDAFEKVLSRVLMILLFFVATGVVFLLFAEDAKERRVSTLADDFITEATKDGVLTKEEYLIFSDSLASFNEGYEIKLEHQSYMEDVSYRMADAGKIGEYFASRNILLKPYVPIEEFELPIVNTEGISLQQETNASIMASLSVDRYVPLPDDDITEFNTCEALVSIQECYEGENLITVVLVRESGMVYYLACDDIKITGTGTATVELKYRDVPVGATVDVTVYPRTRVCAEGHESVLTREMINEYKITGTYGGCEHCSMVPDSISVDSDTVNSVVGTEWKNLPMVLNVLFKDGHTDSVSLDDEELFHDYDANYCGSQTVTVSYRGLKAECATVVLEGADCISCNNKCIERSFADYSRFKYCNTCLSTAPFYFGDTYTLKEVVHHEEIMKSLDTEGFYVFNRGDYLKVSVKRIADGIPVPFLSKRRSTPVVSGGDIRTNGRN